MSHRAQTVDSNGHAVVVDDFVRYHGSKAARVSATLLKVKRIYPSGVMDLRHEGAFPFWLYRVRPQSVTFDC